MTAQTQQQDDLELLDLLMGEDATSASRSVIPRREDPASAPLSFAQQRLLAICQANPLNPAYHIAGALRLQGDLNTDALKQAVRQIAARHDSLRTRFLDGDGTAVVGNGTPEFRVVEVTDSEELPSQMQAEAITPFNLQEGPLLRLTLYRLEPDHHVLQMVVHHLISDGWSLGLMTEELGYFYTANLTGQEGDLPKLAIQYGDYAAWQQSEETTRKEDLDYWLTQLAEPPGPALPTQPRPAEPDFRGGLHSFTIPQDLVKGLEDLANQEGATLFMALLGVFFTLQHRYGNQDDIRVGAPTAGRNRPELEPLLGFFVNMIVLKGDFSQNPSFRQLLAQSRRTALEAFERQDTPLEQLTAQLVPERDLSYNPLFQTAFSMENAPEGKLELPGLSLEPIATRIPTAKFDLTLTVTGSQDGMAAELEYATALFHERDIQAMANHYLQLIRSVIAQPDLPAGHLPMMDAAERRKILEHWNQTETAFPQNAGLARLFEDQAARTPKATALKFGSDRVSYEELNQQANRLAALLTDRGLAPEQPVGVAMDQGSQRIVAVLAILKAGGAYVPLDANLPAQRLAQMLEDCRLNLILADVGYRDLCPDIPTVCPSELASDLASKSPLNPAPLASGQSLAYIIFTSGSTGVPKGNAIPQQAVTRLVINNRFYGFSAEDRVVQLSNFSFDAATMEIWGALLNGGCLIGLDKETLLSPPDLARFLDVEEITVMFLTSALFTQTAQTRPDAFSRVRCLLVGGDAVDPDAVRRVLKSSSPKQLCNAYGPTEVTTFSFTGPIDLDETARTVPIGRPISNTTAYVCDARQRLAPTGVPGELLLGGPGLSRGYVNRPGQTAERFMPNPFGPAGSRLYRSGDLVKTLPNGEVVFLGRIDNQVKIRGFRIEPAEIEAQLLGHHEVREALVLPWNKGPVVRLVAWLAANDTFDARQYLSQRLPDYMIPAAFVNTPGFPLNANGKLDRKRLIQDHPPVFAATSRGRAPQTEKERVLAEIWSRTLGTQALTTDQNYFQLGGDSILAIQVVNRLLAAGWSLKVRDLFTHKTLGDVAAQLQPAGTSGVKQTVEGTLRPTPVQRWYFEQFHHHGWFNQSVLLTPSQPLDQEWLTQAVAALWRHHDALRLVFPSDASRDPHHLDPHSPPKPQLFKLEDPDELEMVCEGFKSVLQLETGPLFAAARFVMPQGERLLLTANHLVVDGVSWRFLLEDLEAAYTALAEGKDPELGLKSCSFQAFSQEIHQLAENLEPEAVWWEETLSQPSAHFPSDARTDTNFFGEKETTRLAFSPEETALILKDVHEAYHTEINDLLLAALAMAASRLYGPEPRWITLEGHGRDLLDHEAVNRTVGWFTTLFPFRLDGTETDPGAVLKQVKEDLRNLPRNGAAYGLLKYLANQDLPQVAPRLSFNYLGGFSQEAAGLLTFSGENHGADVNPNLTRPHDLDMGGILTNDQLSFWVDYHPGRHKRETVDELLNRFRECLLELAHHCRSRKSSEKTPADFITPIFTLKQYDDFLNHHEWEASQVEDVMALSPLQEGLLFQSLFDQESQAYFVQLNYLIEGDLNLDAFKRSWSQLTRRQPALRTVFVHEGLPRPVQIILKDLSQAVVEEDLSHLDPEAQQQRLDQWLAADRERGFHLGKGPLSRLALFRLGPKQIRVVWSYHHLLLDGWCMGVIFRDWTALYASELEGCEADLPEAAPYSRYIQWLARNPEAQSKDYWADLLADFQQPTGPVAFPENSGEPEDYGQEVFVLDTHATDTLKARASGLGVTLNTMVQGAWARLLARYNNSDDVVFGAVVSGRPASLEQSEEMAGLFINTVPVRVRFPEDRPFSQILQDIQEQALAAEPHHACPLSEIQAASPCGPDLFNHILVFENYPVEEELDRSNQAPFQIKDISAFDRTHYPFDITIQPGEQLIVAFGFNPKIHPRDHVKSTARHLQQSLQIMGRDLNEAPLVPDAGDQQLLQSFRTRDAAWPEASCFAELFEENAMRWPNREAVVFEDERLTYGELNQRVQSLAHRLLAEGLGPETLVAVCLPRGVDMITAVLAVQAAGGAHTPMDSSYPIGRLEHMMEDASLLITWSDTPLTRLPERVLHMDALDKEVSSEPLNRRVLSPHQLAYVVYTSGSTGKPKGAMVDQQAWLNTTFAYRREFGLGRRPVRHLQMAGFSFDVFEGDLARALGNGGTLVVAPRETILDPPRLWELLQSERIQAAEFVPAVFRPLAAHMAETARTLPQMQCLIVSSDSWDINDYRQFRQLFGPQTSIVNSYGVTEAAIDSCFYSDQGVALQGDRPVPVGKPFPNTGLDIMDPQLRRQPPGVTGELTIGGRSVARGYRNQPALTAAKFTPNPNASQPGSRLYRTGDKARYLWDGNLEFLGRLDFQLKLRGVRMEPGEIENALTRHPQVQAAVAALTPAGGGEFRLTAWHQTTGQSVDGAQLRTFLQDHLPEPMIPSAFVPVKSWPLTGAGKINRQQLPAPTEAHLALGSVYTAPRTGLEKRLARIWSQVLEVERVGVNDNFFELGGHSLKAMRITSAVQVACGVRLSLQDLFNKPTIAGIAPLLDVNRSAHGNRIEPAPPASHYPLSHTQARFWLMHHMGGHTSLNMSDARVIQSSLDHDVLLQVFNRLMERHEILRTGFREHNGQPAQFLVPSPPCPVKIFDVSEQPDPEAQAMILARQEASRPFDLSQPPLFRATYVKLNPEQYVFVMTIHHIIGDGWSDNVLYGEMMTLYTRFKNGQDDPIPLPRVHFKDYVAWREIEGYRKESALWAQRMPQLPEPLNLPYDGSPEGERTFAGGLETLELGPDIIKPLARLAGESGVLRAHVVLALLNLLLHRLTGQDQITVGLTLANRNHPDLERMIGAFVNILPTQITVRDGDCFKDLLMRSSQDASQVLEGQAYPLDLLVRDLNPARDQARQNLFNVVLTYANFSDLNLAVWEDPNLEENHREQLDFELPLETANFDLIFLVNDQGDQLRMDLNYDTDLFQPQTIQRFLSVFKHFAQLAGALPDASLRRFTLTDPHKDQALLRKLGNPNDWESDDQARAIHQVVAETARTHPEAVALFSDHEVMTYAQLESAAAGLAETLNQKGLRCEELVALRMEPTPLTAVAMYAVLKAGGAYLPLDPSQPLDRVIHQINDTGATMAIFDPDWFDEAFSLAESCPSLEWVFNLEEPDQCMEMGLRAEERPATTPSKPHPDQLAYVMYTSGSTGQAKGVLIPHRGPWRICADRSWGAPDPERFVQAGSLSFDASTLEIWRPLMQGGACGFPSRETVLDPTTFQAFIQKHEVTTLFLTTQLFNRLADDRPELFDGLAQVHTGGEKVSAAHVNRIRERCPNLALYHVYGPTENTTYSTRHRVEETYGEDVPIGKPIPRSTAWLMDKNHQPVFQGVTGELCTGGEGLARGYLNRPGLTAAVMTPAPFGFGRRLYKTGDLARWNADGDLVFQGRRDAQVKVRGHRIEPAEVERHLVDVATVGQAAVLARKTKDGMELAAWMTVAGDVEISAIREELKQKLPHYMIPKWLTPVPRIPLKANGKVDLAALPEPEEMESGRHCQPPESETERVLLEIWRKVLDRQDVGVTDNFFDVGGHSLALVNLSSLITERLDQVLALNVIFNHPTIRSQARYFMDQARFGTEAADNPVALLNGNREARPLFVLPPGTGDAIGFLPLAEMLHELAFYGFTFIEATSRIQDYADLIQERMGNDPPVLMGYSSGGNLAYHVAAELEKRGCEGMTVILLDSDRRLESSAYEEAEIEGVTRDFLNDPIVTPYLTSEILKDKVRRKIRSSFQWYASTTDQHMIGANLHLILEEPAPEGSGENWRNITRGELQIHRGSGPHNEMLWEAHLQKNAGIIRQILNNL